MGHTITLSCDFTFRMMKIIKITHHHHRVSSSPPPSRPFLPLDSPPPSTTTTTYLFLAASFPAFLILHRSFLTSGVSSLLALLNPDHSAHDRN